MPKRAPRRRFRTGAWLGFAWLGFAWLGFAWLGCAWVGCGTVKAPSKPEGTPRLERRLAIGCVCLALAGLVLLLAGQGGRPPWPRPPAPTEAAASAPPVAPASQVAPAPLVPEEAPRTRALRHGGSVAAPALLP